jgi:hypothetical protein
MEDINREQMAIGFRNYYNTGATMVVNTAAHNARGPKSDPWCGHGFR